MFLNTKRLVIAIIRDVVRKKTGLCGKNSQTFLHATCREEKRLNFSASEARNDGKQLLFQTVMSQERSRVAETTKVGLK